MCKALVLFRDFVKMSSFFSRKPIMPDTFPLVSDFSRTLSEVTLPNDNNAITTKDLKKLLLRSLKK